MKYKHNQKQRKSRIQLVRYVAIILVFVAYVLPSKMAVGAEVGVKSPPDLKPVAAIVQASYERFTTRKELPTTCADYYYLIKQYAWDTFVASAVMRAESGCNPNAIGDTWPIGGVLAPSCGLLQIRTLPGRPSCEWLRNPENNIKYAFGLYQVHGWQPWTGFTSGNYLRYL